MREMKVNDQGETTLVHFPETSDRADFRWRVLNNDVGDYLFFSKLRSASWETVKQVCEAITVWFVRIWKRVTK